MSLFHKLFLLLLFFSPLLLAAQANYKPGYAVTVKGDTVRGLIDLQDWDSNPSAISFKSDLNERNNQKFTTNDISMFTVNGFVTYKKFAVSVSMDETNTTHLVTGRDTSYRVETVFLKVLQQGKNVALYSYSDHVKTRFYIGEYPDYVPTELIYRLYLDPDAVVDNHGRSVNENTYLKQLFALANKYNVMDDDLTRDFERANYLITDLLPIVSKINGITNKEFEKKYAGKTKSNLFVGAALNIASISSTSGSSYAVGGGKSYTSYQPAVSLGVNILPNPATGRIEFRLGITAAETKFDSRYKLAVSPYIPETATYNQLGISIAPEIMYDFYNSENLKFYGGVGFSVTHFIYSNIYFGPQDPKAYDNGVGMSNPLVFNGNDDNITIKAGIQIYQRFEIFASYAGSTPTTRSAYWGLSTVTAQVGFVYLTGR